MIRCSCRGDHGFCRKYYIFACRIAKATKVNHSILDELNDNQREIVLYCDGPAMVVAGAGSGKTRVLTYKIIHLLEQGLAPYSILALTFTNKAAREMKHRIATLTDESLGRRLSMGTFHSIFYRILRREAKAIGYRPDFTIYDASDSKNLIRSIIKEMQLDEKTYRPGMVQSRISNAKNRLITGEAYERNKELLEYDTKSKVPMLHEIYRRYQSRCYQAGVMDFDELLLQTNLLFRDHRQVLEKYQELFRYVLVDEYQDTNFAQHLIVTRLCEKHRRICVVGDDAQSIYSFRGANIDNMLRFKDQYPDYRLFKLERNYRSTQNIVNAANSLIRKNKGQIPKHVYSENEPGSKIRVLSAYSDYEEGYLIASQILELRMNERSSYAHFAVLYRTNAQSRILEEALRKRNIAYKIYGGQSFYQRKEIKDLIAYFRVIVNPHDEEALKRIINYPARGIGDATVGKLLSAADRHQVSVWTALSQPADYTVPIHEGTARKLREFQTLMEELMTESTRLPAKEMAELTIKRSGIAAQLFQDRSVEGISRQENMQELLKAIHEFCENKREEGNERVSLADFLMEVSLLTDQDSDREEDTDKVTLMTVHAAKGLEFDHVIIAGMEENLFPSSMAMDSVRAIEEERRLFYVAITRAKRHCIITCAKSRFRNGQHQISSPSHFLDDIDPTYLHRPDDSGMICQPIDPQRYEPACSRASYSPQPTRNTSSPSRLKRIEHKEAETIKQVESLNGLHVGDTIRHERFGKGKIVSLEGEGSDAKATVHFDYSGSRTLLLKYAKITVIK